jgi:hypothetical protein
MAALLDHGALLYANLAATTNATLVPLPAGLSRSASQRLENHAMASAAFREARAG